MLDIESSLLPDHPKKTSFGPSCASSWPTMPLRRTLALKIGRRKDVTALRAEELIKWANQQTSHKLSRFDENIIRRKRISCWLCFKWGTPSILRNIGLTNGSIAMLLYVNSQLIRLSSDEVIEDDRCRCCYCGHYDDYESYPFRDTSLDAIPYSNTSRSGHYRRFSVLYEHFDEDDL